MPGSASSKQEVPVRKTERDFAEVKRYERRGPARQFAPRKEKILPNAIANKFLGQCVGRLIEIENNGRLVVGKMLEFDNYSILLEMADKTEVLFFKGPGMSVVPIKSGG
jgi:hypothetical protein